ncbi:guanylate kinase [Mycoplasma sp. P36-A1]|uniref:guanylate kinase n=1 Tax=Mycoplasma sp. P36-A1 TaxID=3252900 RepID=UPI003C2CF96E
MKKGKLIILSGPSGVGKGTIRERLFEESNLNLAYSISMTTRKPRVGEQDGVDYFFVSEEEFLAKIQEHGLIEWAQFVGNYYGTPKAYVQQLLNEGKNVLLEIEVQGATQVKSMVPEALTIFIVPPTIEELERRIRGRRTEVEEVVQQRLNKAKYELTLTNNYSFVVENNDLEQTVSEIDAIIRDNV